MKELQKQLEEMAKEPPPQGGDAKLEEKLEDAEQGLKNAQGQLTPTPVEGQGPQTGPESKDKQPGNEPGGKSGKSKGKPTKGKGKGKGKDESSGDSKPGEGEPGGDSDPGPSNKGPAPPTKKIEAGELRARANAKVNKGSPNPGMTLSRTGARPGETANTAGAGALGTVGPDEVSGVSRSEVPEEYREQVGRYFEP
jgi:hypothetical protein